MLSANISKLPMLFSLLVAVLLYALQSLKEHCLRISYDCDIAESAVKSYSRSVTH